MKNLHRASQAPGKQVFLQKHYITPNPRFFQTCQAFKHVPTHLNPSYNFVSTETCRFLNNRRLLTCSLGLNKTPARSKTRRVHRGTLHRQTDGRAAHRAERSRAQLGWAERSPPEPRHAKPGGRAAALAHRYPRPTRLAPRGPAVTLYWRKPSSCRPLTYRHIAPLCSAPRRAGRDGRRRGRAGGGSPAAPLGLGPASGAATHVPALRGTVGGLGARWRWAMPCGSRGTRHFPVTLVRPSAPRASPPLAPLINL